MLVVGIDVALRNTGVAAIEDGRATWRATIKVEGEELGPRYVKLREAFQRLMRRMRVEAPGIVAVEQPELGIRRGHDAASVLKLFGAFATLYVEAQRLWPRSRVIGVEPRSWKGNMKKGIMARVIQAKYGVKCHNWDEADALGVADWAAALCAEKTK